MQPKSIVRAVRRAGRAAAARVGTELDGLRTRRRRADLAVFHELAQPPAGGGHQFIRALVRELEGRGLAVELNLVSGRTPACLFNSFNFDFARLRRFADRDARMVHRVDGPIGVYRGFDDGTDARIAAVNAELAQATVCQSRFSLEAHRRLGIALVEPVVIPNAPDPAIFHPPAEPQPRDGRPVRVVATSWSDNPRKGADALRALGAAVDAERFELTFVGRQPTGGLPGWKLVGPVASEQLGALLRGQDVYVAPSFDDPCSNALLEALACGLPAAYRSSGGHPELVGEGGLPFRDDEELSAVLERLVAELDDRRASIVIRPISWVADRYLEVLGLRAAA